MGRLINTELPYGNNDKDEAQMAFNHDHLVLTTVTLQYKTKICNLEEDNDNIVESHEFVLVVRKTLLLDNCSEVITPTWAEYLQHFAQKNPLLQLSRRSKLKITVEMGITGAWDFAQQVCRRSLEVLKERSSELVNSLVIS